MDATLSKHIYIKDIDVGPSILSDFTYTTQGLI